MMMHMTNTAIEMAPETQMAANVIRALGGPQIFSMAFRHAFTSPTGVTFHIPRGIKTIGRCDRVHVELCADDTYTVRFLRYNRRKLETVDTAPAVEMVYADSLRAVVEVGTGLLMTLGTMGR